MLFTHRRVEIIFILEGQNLNNSCSMLKNKYYTHFLYKNTHTFLNSAHIFLL